MCKFNTYFCISRFKNEIVIVYYNRLKSIKTSLKLHEEKLKWQQGFAITVLRQKARQLLPGHGSEPEEVHHSHI